MLTHVGNEFMFDCRESAHILSLEESTTQLSYFILLQEPKDGGELVV